MPPRRKRQLEDEEDGDDIPSTPASEGRPKRRRNDTTLMDTIGYIFDAIRNQMKDEDTYLCEPFLRVPRRKAEPQYYEVVKIPIDVMKIHQKHKTDQYTDVEDFCKDIELLVENAKAYYAKSTEEYKDACELWEIFETAKKQAPEEIQKRQRQQENEEEKNTKGRGNRGGRGQIKNSVAMSSPMILVEGGSPMTMNDAVEELFGAVMTAMDGEGRLYSYSFRLLPSKEKYPDYYNFIEKPIDMKTIAQCILSDKYKSLDKLEDDLFLCFDNACTFNEPGSQIFKDARALKKLVQLREEDLNHILNSKKDVRLRSRRSVSGEKWSFLVSQLVEGAELPLPEEEAMGPEMATREGQQGDEDDSDDDVDTENPFWKLYLAAKNFTISGSLYQLSEPFRRLPNRRWHADYYVEIKSPISFAQIRRKVTKSEYLYIDQAVQDFNLMFDNAQQYNRPDSRIYRDALTLQKFVQSKAEELANLEEDDSDSDSDEEDSMGAGGAKRKLIRPNRPLTFKRRAKILFKTLMDYMTEDGRQPIVAFIERPSRSDYPDYYEVINTPIDMETIESKIRSAQYNTEEELVADFTLMLKNCKTYNEEGSLIFSDACILERVLYEKIRELNQAMIEQASPRGIKMIKRVNQPSRQTPGPITGNKQLRALYQSVRDFRDNDNRQISEVFMKLPSKLLFADYYEVIRQPIDLERIFNKVKINNYQSLDQMMQDLVLMFQNACCYNDPESQIYRDALTLQKHAIQHKLELSHAVESIPVVKTLVKELLMSLFISVFNHEDENGRYTTESFSQLPDYEESDGKKSRALSFDIMKRRLDKGQYVRLDHFQEDLFSIFERARKLSKLNSQTFKDSVTLQAEYMKIRDELCNQGSTLSSSALNYTQMELNQDLERNKAEKGDESNEGGQQEMMDDDDSKLEAAQPADGANNSSTLSHNDIEYRMGDFVYIQTQEKNTESPIVHIERLWTNSEMKKMIYGCHYLRPSETFHAQGRRFYEQEVFKSDQHAAYPLSEVVGKCYIMSANDYFTHKLGGPIPIDEKDVYVCESRYSNRTRFFKKIKQSPFVLDEHLKLIERDVPLEMNKVGSVFKERIEKHKEELAELEEETKFMRRNLPNLIKDGGPRPDGSSHFEQYNVTSGIIRLGDFVYVRGSDRKSIRQILQIWVSADGAGFFNSTVYRSALDSNPSGERMFYKQEMYLTSSAEILPLSDIAGRCQVLDPKEYCTMRPTEIYEQDVYICESFLDEMNQRVSMLSNGLEKFALSPQVLKNEIYYFRRPVNMYKFDPAQPHAARKLMMGGYMDSSPQTPRSFDYEDSMDGPPASIGSVDSGIMAGTPKTLKKAPTGKQFQQMTGKKQMTGYILFSAEVRKSITQRNPQANFGEISRLVGFEWKSLTETERRTYEDRAHDVNLISAERALRGEPPDSPSTNEKPSSELPCPNDPNVVFECSWATCDFMFEDLADLSDHILLEGGHVSKVTGVFECEWRGCTRQKKSSTVPFPMLQRLSRHVREVHIQKNTGRIIPHHDRSRNMVPSTRRSILNQEPPTMSYPQSQSPFSGFQGLTGGTVLNYPPGSGPIGNSGQQPYEIFYPPGVVNGSGPNQNRHIEALFVSTPPKTQRLLHSEAYIKYIENMDKPYVSNWEAGLLASQESSIINDSGRLPAHWLGNGTTQQNGNVVNALWSLREYMMKDSLGISKIL